MYTGDYKQRLESAKDKKGKVPIKLVYEILEEISAQAVIWSVDDFEDTAIKAELSADDQDEDEYDEENPPPQLYDRDKFQKALEHMIDEHDASSGITWDTIEYFLDDMCRIEEKSPI